MPSKSMVDLHQQGELFEPDFGHKVQLPAFEGPLDLLLHLIRKHKVDVYDIPISLITEHYLRTLEEMEELDIDVAAEFLVMAAELMHIKSRMLLPNEEVEDEEEGGDPRAELIRRLLEYQAIKEAAIGLAGRDLLEREVFLHHPLSEDFPEAEDPGVQDVDLVELLKAFRRVLDLRHTGRHEVRQEVHRVKDRMLELAASLPGKERISFEEVFEPGRERTRVWLIVTFLAVLELVRLKMLKVVQAQQGGEIHLFPLESLSPENLQDMRIDFDLPAGGVAELAAVPEGTRPEAVQQDLVPSEGEKAWDGQALPPPAEDLAAEGDLYEGEEFDEDAGAGPTGGNDEGGEEEEQ